MPRLTRTQKFAELRDTLANDREPSLSTKDLSGYQDRLTNLTGSYSRPADTNTNYYNNQYEEKEDPKYVWTSFEETPIETLVESFKSEELDKHIENIRNEAHVWNGQQEVPASNQYVREEPMQDRRVEEYGIGGVRRDYVNQQRPAQNMAEMEEQPVEDLNRRNDYQAPVYEAPREPRPSEEIRPAQNVNYYYPEEVSDDSGVTYYDEPVREPEATTYDEPVREVQRPQAQADNHEADHSDDVINSYISEMMDEVSAYNKMNGERTIHDLTNNMVNEVRHPNESRNTGVQFRQNEVEEDDDEFSNTVSTEIGKIMDEISTRDDSRVEEPEQPEEVLEAVEEPHPVLTKALEEEKVEEVVEIKNLKELEAEPVRETNTISNTIPFVVASEDEDVIDDEDEDEGSNTILNIILIVLIIVLVAVLGLIIFYILKTKGII